MNTKQKQLHLNGAAPNSSILLIGLVGKDAPRCACRMKRWALLIFSGALLFSETVSFAQAPPLNDDFENRITLTGSSVTFTGTLQNATLQPGEPLASSQGYPVPAYYAQVETASVWWSWTASNSEPVTIELLNSSTNEFKLGGIDAWEGTNWSSGFNLVGGMSLDIGRHPFYTFAATAGTTYQLRVVGTNYGDFTLRITETNRPIIVIQPFSRTVSKNGSVFFGVVAAGNPPFSVSFAYQWRFNGVDLPGETFPILGLDNLTTNHSGIYSVMVSNAVTGTLSDTATLNVTEATASPQLTPIGNANGRFDFRIQGELGRLYRIQSSTNLVNWYEEKSFPEEFIFYGATLNRERNGLVYNYENVFSAPQSGSQKVYRTMDYVPPLAACINNLAEIRFAKEIWSLENRQLSWFTPTSSDVSQYLKHGGSACPLGGPGGTLENSYIMGSVRANPVCRFSNNHVLEEPEY
jgi:hypothetical protein